MDDQMIRCECHLPGTLSMGDGWQVEMVDRGLYRYGWIGDRQPGAGTEGLGYWFNLHHHSVRAPDDTLVSPFTPTAVEAP